MVTFLIALHVLICVLLVVTVLLQFGKGAEMGAVMGGGASQAVLGAFKNVLHVALYEPEIPPNTGNIARLCVCNSLQLHLVHPLGFQINDRNLKPMMAGGWLQQAPGVDKRSRLISITDEGRALRSQAQRHWRKAQDQVNDKLGVQRVVALHDLVQESLSLLADAG